MTEIPHDVLLSFNLFFDEVLTYDTKNKSKMLLLAFKDLDSSIVEGKLSVVFANNSITSAITLAEYGYEIEFLASMLLFYPYMFKTLRDYDFQKYGKSVQTFLGTLFSLSKLFDQFRPWEKNSINSPKQREIPKKEFWTTRTNERKSDAFLAVAGTPEVAVIKLVDRVSTLKNITQINLSQEVSLSLANDTLDLYAPIAEALGIWSLKWQLEDYAFKIINPDVYSQIVMDLQEKRKEREDFINKAIQEVSGLLLENNIVAQISGRPKHIYGLYKKMMKLKKPIMEINDNMALRIVTEGEDESICYDVLSLLFSRWKTASGIYENDKKVRDWIINPKPNGYQSIHTTIIMEDRLVEVQIRTQEMHDVAEYGAAAHWIYKKKGNSDGLPVKYQNYVSSIIQLREQHEKHSKKRGK